MGHHQVFPAICMIGRLRVIQVIVRRIGPSVGALQPHGQLIALGIPFDAIKVDLWQLVIGSRSITSRFRRPAIEEEDTLRFSAPQMVEPRVEPVPLPSAEEAYPRLMAGMREKNNAIVLLSQPSGKHIQGGNARCAFGYCEAGRALLGGDAHWVMPPSQKCVSFRRSSKAEASHVASIGEFGDSNLLHNGQPRDGPLCAGSPRRLGVSIYDGYHDLSRE